MTKGYDGKGRASSWKARTSGWPLWAPLELPRNHCFSYSWAPPGFSCPYFINDMKITVFIDIVTPNGLLNSMIFSCVLQIPNYRKNKENINSLFSLVCPLF